MKVWKSCAYYHATRQNQPNPMASNGRLVVYFLLSILVVVNAGMTHDGGEMAMETLSHKAPTSFKAGDSSPSIDHAKFTMNEGSSGPAPGLMTMAKADTKVSVPDERAYAREKVEALLRIVNRDHFSSWLSKDQTIFEMKMELAVPEWLRGQPYEGEYQHFEKLQQIVNRNNFSSEKIEDQSVIDSITEKAVGWLRERPYEWAYRLFEELFVSSPNIAIRQSLDKKDQVYLVKLGHKTAQWIKPREMKPGRTTTTETFDSIGELLHAVFESSLVATKDKRVLAEVLDASRLWKLNDIHLQRFIDRCLADESILPETSLGIFDPERKLFLVKIDHNAVEWVHPRSPKQQLVFLKHLLAIWDPLIASSWISCEDLTLYLRRMTTLLGELSINENDLNPMPPSMRWHIIRWILRYDERVDRKSDSHFCINSSSNFDILQLSCIH